MFAPSKTSAGAYAALELEGRVASADPHGLIVMLFDGAIMSLSHAESALKARDIPRKAQAISKAVKIIAEGLRASLDAKAGGTLARQLDELYGYMMQRLLEANLRSDPKAVAEVKGLLGELRSAWVAIRTAPAAARGGR